ncbi:proteoglycan 4-like [Nilaparvata lugens]|uniref:proteoglycan 4-like n=1 Tax=Nilaparvata lugens TaxID=108931 RepID=UPI00193D5009|nr:proteoglycan 4-like [Nilaparvata lugens]
MDLGLSFHSLLLVCCWFLLSSDSARASDGRLGRRQLDFDSVNENSDVPVFGRRISSLTKKKQSHLPVSSPDSQSDGSAPDRNYLPGKDYLPPPSALPPKLTNIINIEPPFGSSDQINNAINYTPEPETTTKAVTKRIKVPIPRVRTTTEGYPNIEPAPAENSPNLIKPVVDKHENHSLERLCNDPFHSFLCTGATKQRERITGRLRPQAKIPANVLNGQASFQNERKSPPARPIEPSPSRDFPAFLKPSTTKPVTTTERPVFKGFDTQPTSDFRAYLPPTKFNSRPESNYDSQAASDSRAYLPPTEAPVQPQPSFESREYLPPAKPDSSERVQQRKQFSTQPKSFKSFAQNQASFNNFYNFPVSSTLKPIVVNKVNPTMKPSPYTPQYTTQKPPVFPQFNNFGGLNKFPYKSKYDGYAFETPRTTSPATTILPEPSNLNEFFAKDSKIPQPNDLDSRLYLPPTNAKPSIQPEPSSEDKSFLPPPLPQKPKFPLINPLPAQQLPVRLLPKSTTARPKVDNIVGAGAQNPIAISQGTTERQHTLEELCNDSFHSFLCVPLKPRQRFNGRLRPQAKLPPGLVLPDSSNINEENRLPAPSSTDEQRIKPSYSKPPTTTPQPTPSTTRQPASYLPPIRNNIIPEPSQNELTIIRTTKKPLIHFEPSDAFNPYQAVTKKEPKTITKSYSFSYSHTTTKNTMMTTHPYLHHQTIQQE